jgi:hypothetical protein
MKGTLIAGNTVTRMGLFAVERADLIYTKIIDAGIIEKCEATVEGCERGCCYVEHYGERYHMAEGFKYADFKLAAERLMAALKERERAESEARVAEALGI